MTLSPSATEKVDQALQGDTRHRCPFSNHGQKMSENQRNRWKHNLWNSLFKPVTRTQVEPFVVKVNVKKHNNGHNFQDMPSSSTPTSLAQENALLSIKVGIPCRAWRKIAGVQIQLKLYHESFSHPNHLVAKGNDAPKCELRQIWAHEALLTQHQNRAIDPS